MVFVVFLIILVQVSWSNGVETEETTKGSCEVSETGEEEVTTLPVYSWSVVATEHTLNRTHVHRVSLKVESNAIA